MGGDVLLLHYTPSQAWTVITFLFVIFYRILDTAKPFHLTPSCAAIIHAALCTTHYSDSKLRIILNSLLIYHELHIISFYSYSVNLKYSVRASHVYVYSEALLLCTADTNAAQR
jgi:hypothetical protein